MSVGCTSILTEMSSQSLYSSVLSHFNSREEDCKKTVTDCHLDENSRKCCRNWKFLPSQLGLEHIVVNDIDRKPVDEKEKRRDFFREWKQTKGFEATYGKLILALLKCEQRLDAEKVCELLAESIQAPNPILQQPPVTTSSKHTTRASQQQSPVTISSNHTPLQPSPVHHEGAVGLSHSNPTAGV